MTITTIELPSNYAATVGVATPLSGITIGDDTSEITNLTVGFSSGTVTATAPAGGTAVISPDGTSVTFTGTVTQIGAGLRTVLFTASMAGSNSLRLASSNASGGLNATSIGFMVSGAGTPSTGPTTPGITVIGATGSATVTGAAGNTLTLTFASAALAAQAQPQLTAVSALIVGGSVVAAAASGGALPTVPASKAGLAEIDTGANLILPAGYTTAIDLAGTPVSLIAAASGNDLIIASGTGDLTYAAASGAETVYAGTGNTLVFGGGASLDYLGYATGSLDTATVNGVASGTVPGGSTIIGGSGGNTVNGGDGSQLIFGSSSLDYVGGTGAATIIGGGTGNTVTGGSGNLLIFASSGMTFTGSVGAATIIGGAGPLNARLGTEGGLVYGSPGGDNTIVGGTANSTLVGGGGGDVLSAIGANNVLVAASGAETLNGGGATGQIVLFGGSGNDSLVAGTGSALFILGSGNESLRGGLGSNTYVFVASPGTTRVDTITNFNPSTSDIGLFGYGSSAAADTAALASATTVGGATEISLSDGTTIKLVGVSALHSYNFF